jgi:2-polyprenyl-3-methyl-5-hydroxy-6-metoxy-1,4-benzoquinol methylase
VNRDQERGDGTEPQNIYDGATFFDSYEALQRTNELDVSERMIAVDQAQSDDTNITYVLSSIERYVPAEHSIDLVVCSLAFHYVSHYAPFPRDGFAMTAKEDVSPAGWWAGS